MTKTKDSFHELLLKNAWQLIIAILVMAVTWGVIITRVNAMEEKLAEYPSRDYFELRFDQLDQDIREIKESLK